MNILKKINRGVILTFIVLLGVIIYLVSIQIYNNSQKQAITEVCKNYVELEVKYSMLPEGYRELKSNIKNEDLEAYINQMKKEISAFYPNDYKGYKTDNLELSLRSQAKGEDVIFSFTKDFGIKKFEFSENTVNVTLACNTFFDGYQSFDGTRNRKTVTTYDNVSLVRENGKWYVVDSWLQTDEYKF